MGSMQAAADDQVVGDLIQFNDNGNWSWFQDERVIIDSSGQLLIGSVADSSGAGGRNGIDLATFDFATGRSSRFQLSTFGGDDHNVPALWERPDGRILAMYSRHNVDNFSRWRITTNPGDTTAWGAEQAINTGGPTTYSNVYHLSAENGGAGRTYNFTRTVSARPHIFVSDDAGTTWAQEGVLFDAPHNRRPYLRYASNGTDRVHFITTEGHPVNYVGSGLYHGYFENGILHASDGTAVHQVSDTNKQTTDFTPVFTGGDATNQPWTNDIQLDADGNPYIAYQVRRGGARTDPNRTYDYRYARWDGTQWSDHALAFGGTSLYGEDDYSGNISLVAGDPNTVYIATDADPVAGIALISTADGQRHHEIFKGVTADGGATWAWTAITQNSSVDNFKPIFQAREGNSALLWTRGTFNHFIDYDRAVVGVVEREGERRGQIDYYDAGTANTTLADGTPWNPLGPSIAITPVDGSWHERTGFGNGGSVFVGDELGNENLPRLETTVTATEAGLYEVFVYFWSVETQQWQIAAGLDENALREIRKQGAEQVDVTEFSDANLVTSGPTVSLYQGSLGRVDLAAGEDLSIFIDDLPGGVNARAWYDGVGLARVLLWGDANDDGFVGVEDLDILLANWGEDVSAPFTQGDVDGDGTVGQGDLDLVIRHWSNGDPPDVNIPEPGSLSLLGLGSLMIARRAVRRSDPPSVFVRQQV